MRGTGATVPSSDAALSSAPEFDDAAKSAAYSPTRFFGGERGGRGAQEEKK